MTSAQTVVRGHDWWMGREARNSQKLRACSPAGSPHQAPALPRDAPPKNRENRENRAAWELGAGSTPWGDHENALADCAVGPTYGLA
jgi:hypothetical protein